MEENMEKEPQEEIPEIDRQCKYIWNSIIICKNDYVEIYPRGFRSMVVISGRVKALSDSAIVLETPNNSIAIRYSEIRMIRKLKNPSTT